MRFLTFIILCLLPFAVTAQKQRVWIDTDIMIGKWKHDVDDGLALILTLQDTTIQIEGISFVHGVDYAAEVTEKLLSRYSPDVKIPMHKGADDSTHFGEKTPAVEAMAKALEKGPLTIFALGPMTNVGTVLELYPDLRRNVKRITYCAGRTPGKTFNPAGGRAKFSDYNFDLDPYATAMVLKANVPILLSGYDCSEELFLSKKDFIHLKKSNDETDRWLFRKLRSWHGLWRMFLGSEQGFIPFDCSTVGALLYPEEFEINSFIPAYIQVLENDTKQLVKTKKKPYLLVDEDGAGRIVSYCSETKPAFKRRLLKALDHPDYR
jgi:pyrimidine-specific ribonucleoside hydrolase